MSCAVNFKASAALSALSPLLHKIEEQPSGAITADIALSNITVLFAPAQTGKHQCGRKTFGHSLIISPWGKVLGDGKKKVGVVYAKINLEEVTIARQAIPNLSTNKEYSTNL